jgi:autotransporter-associated beta strand protein
MKPAKLNRMRTFLAGQRRTNHESRSVLHDLPKRLGSLLLVSWFRSPALGAIVVLATMTLFTFIVQAVSPSVWSGGGLNDNWNNAANWTANNVPVPSTTYDLQFAGSTRLTPSNDFTAGSNFRNITFNTGAGAFTLGGNSITLNGNITNSSTNLQTITLNLGTTVVRTFTMTTGGGNITIGLNGDTTKGVISGTGGGVTTAGAGVLTLWGNNTYTGNTTFGNGTTLNINSTTAIGTGALVTPGSSGVFDNTSGSAITLSNNNGLTMSGGSPTFTGTNDLSFGTGAVILSGSAGANRTITVTNAAATLTLNGTVSDGGSVMGITKAGAGTLVLGGTSTASGAFRTNAGILSVSTIGNSAATSNLGTNGTFNFGGGTLRYTGSGETSNKVLNLIATTAGGTIDQSGTGLLKFTGTNTATGNGLKTLTLQGSTAGTGEISGAIVNSTSATSLLKTGSGTWTLSGANGYTGTTTITAGTLTLGASGVLADASNMVLNGGTFSTGATTGFTETAGTLGLTDHSTIALGTGVHSLIFANSSGVAWTAAKKLVITGWVGGYNGTSGTAGKIFVGSDASGLMVSQLDQISFYDGTNSYPAVILSSGEVVPGPGPSAVKLTKFNAASFADGVQLTWESGFEVNNLGYRLYREQNGRRTRVTPSIVAGSTLLVGQGNRLTAGYSYSWFDPQGTPGTAYYLEAIDLDSSRQTHGPIYPYGGSRNGVSPKRERTLLLNELGKSFAANSGNAATTGWPAAMSAAARSETLKLKPQSLGAQQAIAGGKAVKLQVRQTGWYRVTQPELVAAGLDPSSDARLLQLYVDGEEVPVRLSAEGARLSASDTLEFYGVALDTQTTDTRTYWLINGTTAGKRISWKRNKIKPGDQNWTDSAGLSSFAFTTERREKLIYSPRLLNGDAENIFGALIFTDPTEQTLAVKNFDRESATPVQLEVALQGLTAQGHEVHVMLNGADLGSLNFGAAAHSTATFAVNRALLHEGDNTVSLASGNGDSDISFVDYVRLTYAHQYKADNNALRFSVPGGGVVRVDGFSTANIRVVDITDPSSPLELATSGSPSGAGYSVKVQALGSDTRTLLAFADDLTAHPASITANQPSNWNASNNGADLVIITHKDFRQAIEPLATLRRNQGFSVAVVDAEDVYDEFSYGAHSPTAIKAFLMNAAGTWARKPGYLLLVGDSSWDPRNFMDQGANDFVPTKLIDTNYMETASDDWLVDFTGLGNAAMALGRLPGRTAPEVSLMVSKILAYEQERELNVPLRGAVMVADTGFESQSAQTRALLPAGVSKQSLDRAAIGNDDLMRGQLLEALNQGPMIVNFYGHGSVGVWTGAGVLDSELADTLTNTNRASIYLMMTCLNGYAHDAYIDSLSESVLKAPNGGAVAVWASSGFTTPPPQFAMDSQFYRLLFGGQPLRIGEAARLAKLATSDLDVRRTWILLGDPTMRVR